MKKVFALLMVCALLLCSAFASAEGELISVGIVNNPPSESGYREANVEDFEKVFSAENGYDTQTFYSLKNDEQLNAAQQFITEGVQYLLISAAETTGWDNVLTSAQENGVIVFLFDRMIDCDESLYEAAVVSDMRNQGVTAVEWLKSQSLEEYNIVHIQGVMGSDAQIGRTEPLNEQVAAEPDTWHLVAQQTASWDEAGITHGVDGDVIVMGFDTNRYALRELQAGNWNYDGQCSPYQAQIISDMIQQLEAGEALNLESKKIITEERGFDAATITEEDIVNYGIGDDPGVIE